MNRAVVVLLLLIANAVVSVSKHQPSDPAPPAARTDSSLRLFAVIDGAGLGAPLPSGPCCRAEHNRADARTPLFDVRL